MNQGVNQGVDQGVDQGGLLTFLKKFGSLNKAIKQGKARQSKWHVCVCMCVFVVVCARARVCVCGGVREVFAVQRVGRFRYVGQVAHDGLNKHVHRHVHQPHHGRMVPHDVRVPSRDQHGSIRGQHIVSTWSAHGQHMVPHDVRFN